MASFSRMCFFMNISYLVTQTKSFVDPYNVQTYSSKISDILPVSCWSLPSSLYTFINFSLFFMTNQQGFFLLRKNAGTFPVWKPLSAFLSASFRFMFLSQIPFLLLPLPSFTTLLPWSMYTLSWSAVRGESHNHYVCLYLLMDSE